MALIALMIGSYLLFGTDWDLHIGHGYYLDRTSSERVWMVGPHHVSILPNIDGYKIYERIIVGHVSGHHRIGSGQDAFENTPGYFIVEIRTGKVHQGLSDKAWLGLLRDYGVTRRPALHRPSRYDGYMNRNVPEKER